MYPQQRAEMQSHYNTPPNKSILNEEHNVIKLIRLFRGHECLWNPNCDEYRNLALKESIWESIAEQFDRQVTADQVKRKIKGLRNCFATERTRVQKSILDGREVYVPTLYYYKEFEFLHSVVRGAANGRGTYGNVKAEYSAEEYEENNSREDGGCMYNNGYGDNSDYAMNDNGSNANETNDEMKVFEPIVLSRAQDEPQQYEPPYKRMRSRPPYKGMSSNVMSASSSALTHNKNARQVQSLCEMIKVDLQDISDELFFDAKWKIMDILRDVHRKQLESRRGNTVTILNSDGQTTCSTSASANNNANSSSSSSSNSSSNTTHGVAVSSSANNQPYAPN